MSAISGIFYRDGQPLAEPALRRIASIEAKPGLQPETYWLSGNVGFGHGLSQFTEEDEKEKQPLTSRDGRFTLVAAARIDNRPELAESLQISPGEAAPMADSDFILAALEKWGEECSRHLVGSFAFAAWNNIDRSLLLSRSPRGEQPLYYWTDASRFVFASSPRALFRLGFFARQVNLQKAAEFLLTIPYDQSSSWYEGIVSLEPGHTLVVTPDRIRKAEFWKAVPGPEIHYARDSDYVEAFDELWQRVVSDHLRSRAGTGISLSGGLDSTAVAAVAAPALDRAGKRLAAFTEVPPAGFSGDVGRWRYADETPYVRAVALRYSNIDLNFIRPEGRFFLDGIETYFAAAESPFRNAFNRLWLEAIFSAASTQSVPVLLTGQAGNLTISYAGAGLLPSLVEQGRWIRAWREARAMAANHTASSLSAAVAGGVLPFLPDPLWRRLMWLRHRKHASYASSPWKAYSAIRPEFFQEQRINERAAEWGHDFHFRPRPESRRLTLGFRNKLGDYRRAVESMFGVDLRSPADDLRIVEFCLSVPEDQFLRNGITKWLLRRSMQDKLPEEILQNRRRGLQSASWLDQLHLNTSRMDDELDRMESSPLARNVVDVPRLRRIVVRLRKTGRNRNPDPGDLGLSALIALGMMTGRFLHWTETGN